MRLYDSLRFEPWLEALRSARATIAKLRNSSLPEASLTFLQLTFNLQPLLLQNPSIIRQRNLENLFSALSNTFRFLFLQPCPATTPISLCAASRPEFLSEGSATSAMANARSATLMYDLPLSSVSATSAPSETTKISALSAAERVSATLSTALSVRDLRRIAMDARRSSILAHLGLICSTRRRISAIIELRDDEVGQQAVL